MAGVLMGRFVFYAQAAILSNLAQVGIGGSKSPGSYAEDEADQAFSRNIPLLAESRIDDDARDASKDADRIIDLPGLNYDPGFDQYSGYITVNEKYQRKIFYWYVESQNDPAADPVVLWTNGGPGCSGLLGFGTEHGPFYFSSDGELSPNPYSWNKLANMLYVEQPCGVGFSYSKSSEYTTGDSQAAADSYELILGFLERFPETKGNDLYISSESYGGHYMPQLTREILNRNVDGKIKFKGMMVGNPYVDPYTNTITMFQAWYYHGLLPWPLYDKFVEHCRDKRGYSSGKCQDYIQEMYKVRGKGINAYALDFPMCLMEKEKYEKGGRGSHRALATSRNLEGDASSIGSAQLSTQATQLINNTLAAIAAENDADPPFLPPGVHYHPCAEQYFLRYLNRADVVEAIHANPDTLPWKECSNKINYSQKDWLEPQMKVYESLLAKMDKGSADLNMLIFSGDDDSVCSLAGTQSWIWNLGWEADSSQTWLPWEVANQTAGFITRFRLKNKRSSFIFATVRGAGHEVPSYRPMEALELFRRYLDQDWS